MYIVWGRSWPLVIVPCACIAAYMTLAAVRYPLCAHARSTPLRVPQILLQTSVQVSQSLSDPSRLLEALHEAKMLRNYVIIAFSLALAANAFCTS
jgi:hypothetical protein